MAKSTISSASTVKTSTASKIEVIKSAQQIRFEGSLSKIKSTGNQKADTLAKKIVSKIFNKELKMVGSPEDGFKCQLGDTDVVVEIKRTAVGKSARYVLTVGAVNIGGAFAAKAFAYATTQNKTKTINTVEFDESSIDSVLEIL